MECKFCNGEMIHVDDSGSFTGSSQSWDYYVCSKCRADLSVSTNYSKVSEEWDSRPVLQESHIKRLEEKLNIKRDVTWLQKSMKTVGDRPASGNDSYNQGFFDAWEEINKLAKQLDGWDKNYETN